MTVLIERCFSLNGFNESLKTSYQLSTGTPVISSSLWYVIILGSEALSQYQPEKLWTKSSLWLELGYCTIY